MGVARRDRRDRRRGARRRRLVLSRARDPTENFAIGDLGSLHTSDVPRVVGFFLNANMFSSYLIVGLVFVLALVGWRRPAGIALLAAIGIALVFTLSPGFGGALLAPALWLAASKRDHWSPAVRALVVAAGSRAPSSSSALR